MTLSYQALSKQNSDLDNELSDIYEENLQLIHTNELLKDEVTRLAKLLSLEKIKAINKGKH